MQKYCENCGNEVDSTDVYCAFCGSNLKLQWKAWNKALTSSDNIGLPPQTKKIDTSHLIRYKEITQKLKELDKVGRTLNQHQKYYDRIRWELQEAQQKFQNLLIATEKEYKDVEKLKKLSFKSIKARLQGNKDDLLEKEEREYLSALNRKEAAQKDLQDLQQRLEIAGKELEKLTHLKKMKSQLEEEQIEIINRACEGVADPIEDQIEIQLNNLKQQKQPISEKRELLKNAMSHFQNAKQQFEGALNKLGGAKSMSTWDLFGGGFFVDMIKHSNVSEARDFLQQAYRSVNRGYQLVPNAPRITQANVQEMSMVWDVFFDNIFSDMAARDKIMRSKRSVEMAYADIHKVIDWFQRELGELESDYRDLNEKIKNKNDKLLHERKRMIEEAIRNAK